MDRFGLGFGAGFTLALLLTLLGVAVLNGGHSDGSARAPSYQDCVEECGADGLVVYDQSRVRCECGAPLGGGGQ